MRSSDTVETDAAGDRGSGDLDSGMVQGGEEVEAAGDDPGRGPELGGPPSKKRR
jgi:hypothetical protein